MREPDKDDARDAYEERAAIMEYDGGLSRADAEAAARAAILRSHGVDVEGENDDMVTVGEVIDEVRHRRVLGLPPLRAEVEVAPTEPPGPRGVFTHTEVLERIERIGVATAALIERARARGDDAAVALYEKHLAWCRAKYREARSPIDATPSTAEHDPDRVNANRNT
jgi:hypothetical protein